MTDQATYTREQIALDDARFTMRAHRLTYSVVQTRLREAALEEAADQVAHLEERIATLAPVNSADSRRVMEASKSRSIVKDEKGAILSRIGWHP